MLIELQLSAFKCFSELKLPLRPLTLLAGVNGGGKSTILQSLLLFHQVLADNGASGARRADLPLNGPLLTLGTVRDVVDQFRGGRRFSIGLSTPALAVTWTFDSPRENLAATVYQTRWRAQASTRKRSQRGSELFPDELVHAQAGDELVRMLTKARYVPADRLGPADSYPLLEPARHSTLGPRAERAVGALYWGRDDNVADSELCHPNRKVPARVARQVEVWLNDLFPGVVLNVQPVPNANLATLGIRTNAATEYHRPQHVGFGMTYVLPILVALLSSGRGDLVLLENPEAHLHPRAQVRVAELCVRAARSGIQVLLETHSDHVLNAVRVAVHRGKLTTDQVGIHVFERKPGGGQIWRELRLGPGGQLNDRPDGFFDEIDRQLSALFDPTDSGNA